MTDQTDAERALGIARSWVSGPGRVHGVSADIEKHFAAIRAEGEAQVKVLEENARILQRALRAESAWDRLAAAKARGAAMTDQTDTERAWRIIGYLGEVDIDQIDPDGGDAATFERALSEIADVRAECEARIKALEEENERLNRLNEEYRLTWNAAEDRLAVAQAEITRLLDVAQKEPHTAYLEAVQRACDERMVEQKHRIRDLEARLTAADDLRAELARLQEDRASLGRQLADANGHVAALTAALETRRSACNEERERAELALWAQGKECERADHFEDEANEVREQLSAAWRRAEEAERQLAEMRAALTALLDDCEGATPVGWRNREVWASARAALQDRATAGGKE